MRPRLFEVAFLRKPRRGGFTLLEASIVLSLMAVVMVLVTMYFVRAQRYATDTEAYASVQRDATVVLRKVTSDLYASTTKELGFSDDQDAVWFLSSRSSEPGQPFVEFRAETGKIVWRKWVCYYFEASSGKLFRAERALDSPDSELLTPPTPTPSLTYFQTSPDVIRQAVGRKVALFRVSPTTRGVNVALTTHGEAPLTNTTAEQRLIECSLASQVTLIN